MARYGKDHKQATRRRIIETAGRRFKSDGVDGSGIATLMADAGLTNGAFYAHFDSKEDLLASTVAAQLQAQREQFGEQAAHGGVEQFVRSYLSPQHRDDYEDGCPSAALLEEIGRCSAQTRQAYTEGLLAVIEAIAQPSATGDPQAARVRSLTRFAMMVGTLQLSRALADPELSDAVLEQGVRNILTLLAAPQEPAD